jgi:predicted nucleic acid-binding protein
MPAGHRPRAPFAILTRLPGDARLSGPDAARLLDARFTAPLTLSGPQAQKVHTTLGRLGIAGGAVYDGLVALAAKEHDLALATRDARARATYDAIGVAVIAVG